MDVVAIRVGQMADDESVVVEGEECPVHTAARLGCPADEVEVLAIHRRLPDVIDLFEDGLQA